MQHHIIAVGDLHVRADNLIAVDRLEKWLEDRCSQQPRPTMVVLLGDVLDSHNKVEQTLMHRAHRLFRFITNLGLKLYVLVGNHDCVNNQVHLTDDHWMVVYKNGSLPINIIDRPTAVCGSLLMCPYVPDGKFASTVSAVFPDWTTRFKLVFCHQMFDCIEDIGQFTHSEPWKPEYPMALGAHIHKPQRPVFNLQIAGSYIPVAHGESNEKFLWEMTFDEAAGILGPLTPVPVNFLMRKTVVAKDMSQVSSTIQDLQLKDDEHTRVIINGSKEQLMAWSRTAEAQSLRNKKQVKVVLRATESAPLAHAHGTRTDSKQPTPTTFRETLEGMVSESKNPSVQRLLHKFRSENLSLFTAQ